MSDQQPNPPDTDTPKEKWHWWYGDRLLVRWKDGGVDLVTVFQAEKDDPPMLELNDDQGGTFALKEVTHWAIVTLPEDCDD